MRTNAPLSLWAGLSCLCYLSLAVFYGLSGWASSPAYRELLLWPVLAALLFFYIKAYRTFSMGSQPSSLRGIIASGLLLAIAAVTIPPFHSTDIFGYINRGWQQAHYGLNPYVFTVGQIPGWERDLMLTDHWVNNPSPYGFLYLLIAKALCFLGGGNKTLTLFLFKLSNLGVHLAIGALLYRFAIGSQRQGVAIRAELSLLLYLWNPLILLHGLANGHNDLWLGLFLLLSAGCTLAGAWLWALPALLASALVKYASIIVFPFSLLLFIKNKAWKPLFGGLALSLALFLLSGAPYLPDWPHFHLKEIGRNAVVSHGSLHSFIYSAWKILSKLSWIGGVSMRETVRTALANALTGAYAVFYGGLFLRRLRQEAYTASDWLKDALLAMVVLITLASLKFYPWYLGMFFPLALLLTEGDWLRRFVLGLSGAQLLSFTLVGQAHLLNFLTMTGIPWTAIALPALGCSKRRIALLSGSVVLSLLILALLAGRWAAGSALLSCRWFSHG